MIRFDHVFLRCPALQEHTCMSRAVQEKGQTSLEHLCLVLASSWHLLCCSLAVWRARASLHQRHRAGTRQEHAPAISVGGSWDFLMFQIIQFLLLSSACGKWQGLLLFRQLISPWAVFPSSERSEINTADKTC